MYSNNTHKHFVRYNPILNKIENVFQAHPSTFRKKQIGDRNRVYFVEEHKLKPHPNMKHRLQHNIHDVSKIVDPLHQVRGSPSRIGSYIDLKILPNILNICIKKGVQSRALFLLAKKILEQHQTNKSHILIKRRKSGKYYFKSLISTKALSKHTPESLAEVFVKLVKSHKNYLHLIVKPNERMYTNFNENHILQSHW